MTLDIEMVRQAKASLDGGPAQTLYRGRVYAAPLSVARALLLGKDRPEHEEAGPAAKPAGASDDWIDEEPEWDLQTEPRTYLETHPDGPNAQVARQMVAYQLIRPDASSSPPRASTTPSDDWRDDSESSEPPSED